MATEKFEKIATPRFDAPPLSYRAENRILAQAHKLSQALTVMHGLVVDDATSLAEKIQAAEVMAELAVAFNALAMTLEFRRKTPAKQVVAIAKKRTPKGMFRPDRKVRPKPIPGTTISDLIPL
jgi:hypothetical protein